MRILLLLLLPLALGAAAVPPGSPARLERSVQTRYYDVQGDTARELLGDLRARRPGAYFGQTAYQITFTYRTLRQGNVCSITDAVVYLEVVTTLPRWKPSREVPAPLQWDWLRFMERLERHERQHLRLAEQGASEVRDMLATARGTCGTLRAFVDDRARRIVEQYDRRNRAYDVHTENGALEGVRWPL